MSDRPGPLEQRWTKLRRAARPALIPYITAGFPDPYATAQFMAGAEVAGADLIELGVPWSDPVADGPVIQESSHEALLGGFTLPRVLETLRSVRPEIPVILFSYLNPLLAFGLERFVKSALEAGAAGVLVTDLPVGGDPIAEAALASPDLPLVRLVAPTTSGDRLREVARASRGFVYLIARLGVTGASPGLAPDLERRLAQVRRVTDLPVAVGFGLSSAEQAAAVARHADGVVVGSAVVERMRSGGSPAALEWLGELRAAMNAARGVRGT